MSFLRKMTKFLRIYASTMKLRREKKAIIEGLLYYFDYLKFFTLNDIKYIFQFRVKFDLFNLIFYLYISWNIFYTNVIMVVAWFFKFLVNLLEL